MNKNISSIKTVMILFNILLVCLTVKFLANRLQEINYAALPGSIPCISYESRSSGGQIGKDNLLTAEQIRSDLERISEYTSCVHTYYMLYGMSEVPKIATEFDMQVIAGVWLDDDVDRNHQEVEMAKVVFKENKNILFVAVGNETQLFRKISPEELWKYIEEVKSFSPFPVSTEEDTFFWADNSETAQVVDVISVHILPYWDGVDVNSSVSSAIGTYDFLSKLYPDKKIYVTEIGWPSNGGNRQSAVPSLSNQRKFLAELDDRKEGVGGFYSIVEAFDQPWKIQESEGRVGAHWGIFSANGADKVDANNKIFYLATFIIIVSSIVFNFLFSVRYFRLKTVAHMVSHWFFAVLIVSVTWIVFVLKQEYMLSTYVVSVVLVPSQILLIFIIISHFIQAIRIYFGDPVLSILPPRNFVSPFVSIHIPCRNENPDQVISCVESCLKQDYPFFEIIIIDNNTVDPNIWQPVENFSKKYPEKIKFIHIENLAGFKAGALNLSLKHTDKNATAIAVVDSDYVVAPNWLSSTANYLSENVKVVQSPQSYRPCTNSLLEKAIILEQKMFFEIGMIVRNAANAIIQHGTMCIIDKNALEQVGGWAEWCITEDTELGLRLLLTQHQSLYLPQNFGGGIAPKSFYEYTKQRTRWVFGAVRITLRYFKDLIFGTRLSLKQKYYFISGWIFWFAHIFYLIFVVGAFFGTFSVLRDERIFPPLEFSLPLIIFVSLEILLSFLLVKKITKSKISDIWGLILLGISTTATIAFSVIGGLFYKKKPFMITSKNISSERWPQFLLKILPNICLLVGYIVLIILLVVKYNLSNPDIFVWTLTILILSFVPISVILIESLGFIPKKK